MDEVSTDLVWHAADPVGAAEMLRNNRVHSRHQTNRSPSVDHPKRVNLTFGSAYQLRQDSTCFSRNSE